MLRVWVLVATVTPLAALALKCDGNFEDLELDDNRCYFFSSKTGDNATWTTSYASCLKEQGSLLSVFDPLHFYPMSYKVGQLGVDAWIGLFDIAGNKQWSDNTVYNPELDQFLANAISTAQVTYGYISAEDGLFHLGDGTEPAAYVCYQDMTPPTPPTTTAVTTTAAPTTTAPPCGSAEWIVYNKTCYLFTKDKQYWAAAGHGCHEMDAELVSVHSAGLVTFLLLRAEDTVYWTGLQDENGTYVWEDGTPTTDVDDVLANYLDKWEEGKNCVAMDKSKFPDSLVHEDCFTLHPCVCHKPLQ